MLKCILAMGAAALLCGSVATAQQSRMAAQQRTCPGERSDEVGGGVGGGVMAHPGPPCAYGSTCGYGQRCAYSPSAWRTAAICRRTTGTVRTGAML